MTLTVFRDVDKEHDLSQMFLDINNQDYKIYYQDQSDALPEYDISIDPPPGGNYDKVKYKLLLQLDIWDNFENQGYTRCRNFNFSECQHMIIINNAWDTDNQSERLVYNDFLFNRTKAYYYDFKFKPDTKLWYYRDRLAYSIPNNDVNLKHKIFIGPNKTWVNYAHRKTKYRPMIFQKLLEYRDYGYIGNSHVNPEYFLIPQFVCPDIVNVNELPNKTVIADLADQSNSYNRFGYSPPHDAYYHDTFISIYGETIEYGSTIAPTEKTYDPLIKGHFVLPFSSTGFIKFLKTEGFKFPEFIDYSYDDEIDDDIRINKYLSEVDRLNSITLNDWKQHWVDNADIRLHNQLIFRDCPYDRVDLYQLIEQARNY